MPQGTTVIGIPLPRVVTGLLRRAQAYERVAVLDDVNVAVASVSGEDAPVAVRLPRKGAMARARGSTWRAHDGAFWRPLDYGLQPEGVEPRHLYLSVGKRIVHHAGLAGDGDAPQGQELADWEALLRGVNKRRGLPSGDHVRFTDVTDDGRAAQAALAESVAANLLLVDGRLHHRSPEPRYVVDWHDGDGAVTAVAPFWPVDGSLPLPMAPAEFPVDRGADAMAFCKAMMAEAADGDGVVDPDRDAPEASFASVVEIVDMRAFRSAALRPSVAEAVRGLVAPSVKAACPIAGMLDDASLHGYLALRAGIRDGFADDAAALAAVHALRRMADGYAASMPEGNEHWREKADEAAGAAREALARWDLSERRHLLAADDDEIALDGLGMAP